MGIRLIKRQTEGSATPAEFQGLLDELAALYANNVQFKYDPDQNAVVVTKNGNVLGSVRSEGALHTVIWETLNIAETKA